MPDPVFHGGGLAAAVATHGGAASDWLDLSTGINPWHPPVPNVSAPILARLPDDDLEKRAIRAARKFHGVPHDAGILPVAGIQGVIPALPHLRARGHVAIASPTYGEYAPAFRLKGWTVAETTDPFDGDPGIVLVVNPNNPDGRRHDPDALLGHADRLARRGGLLVVDEAFGDLDPALSLEGKAGRQGLLVLKSFGKFFGLAGIRLGFALGHVDDIALLRALVGPWSVSGPALVIGATLMDGHPRAVIADGIRRRAAAQAKVLSARGITIAADCGLFQLVAPVDAGRLHHHLCERRILSRAFGAHPGWLRFGLCADDAALARLDAALAEYAA